MSIEKPLRDLVQAELKARLAPMHKAIVRMDERLDVVPELVDIIHRLAPLATRMQSLQLALPGLTLPIPGRGKAAPAARAAAPAPRSAAPAARAAAPAREAAASEAVPAPRGRPAGKATGKAVVARAVEDGRRCAVIGCKRPSRSKGYCSAHYQKLRLLVKSGRRPESWVDDAQSQSVADVVLPRGRAASKAREETPAPAAVRPEPPKPKAWVRKKGAKERVSLH